MSGSDLGHESAEHQQIRERGEITIEEEQIEVVGLENMVHGAQAGPFS